MLSKAGISLFQWLIFRWSLLNFRGVCSNTVDGNQKSGGCSTVEVGRLYHYLLQGSFHPRSCRISFINSMFKSKEDQWSMNLNWKSRHSSKNGGMLEKPLLVQRSSPKVLLKIFTQVTLHSTKFAGQIHPICILKNRYWYYWLYYDIYQCLYNFEIQSMVSLVTWILVISQNAPPNEIIALPLHPSSSLSDLG